MKARKLYLKIIVIPVICIILGCLLAAGCSTSHPTNVLPSGAGSGAAAVTVRAGKIGMLAKTKTIEMEKLIIQIGVKGIDTIVMKDTVKLSGYGETVINKTYPGLKAPADYTLNVQSLDATGRAIHSGSADFISIPGDTVEVSLNLDAKYSMLRVSFNEVPDRIKNVMAGISAVDTLDSTFVAGSRGAVVLTYDYLAASSDGVNHPVSLRASGSFYGKDTVLYAADTTISAVSGVDKSYNITLKWVGPGVPSGAATMAVIIGAIGTTLLNTGFTPMGGLSDLVDDLEDGDEFTRYNTVWWAYNDSLFGGKSKVTPPHNPDSSQFKPVVGGVLKSAYSASFTYALDKGEYEYEPYAGMGFDLDPIHGLDISSATGIRFYCKGNAFRVRLHTPNVTDYGFWGCDISASTDWKLVELTWSQFNQPAFGDPVTFDRTAVTHISFEVLGKTGDSGTVWVDDIHLTGYLR